MNNLESNICGKKKFSDLLKEIYDNQKKKEAQISALIGELKPLINDIGDATLIVPLIKEYMEISVKNDDHLIKMASIVQRLSTGGANSGDGGLLTNEEMDQLMDVAEEIAKNGEIFVKKEFSWDKYVDEMEKIYDGKHGTPYSIMIVGDQQGVINGAQPYATVKQMLDTVLGQVGGKAE